MSESTAGSEPRPVKKTIRTVTPPYRGRPDVEMNTIGWGIFLVLVVLLVPLLPYLLIGWVIAKLIGYSKREME